MKDVGKYLVYLLHPKRVQYDDKRGSTTGNIENISLSEPFNKKSNFNVFYKENPLRRLIDLEIDGHHIAIDVNMNWLIPYDALILFEPENCHRQLLTGDMIRAIHSLRKLINNDAVHIGFNTRKGGASVPHAHFRLILYPNDILIEIARESQIILPEKLALPSADRLYLDRWGTVDTFMLHNYPTRILGFDLEDEAASVKAAINYVELLLKNEVSYNTYFLDNKLIVWPRIQITDGLGIQCQGIAFPDLLGITYATESEDFEIDTKEILEEILDAELRMRNITKNYYWDLYEQAFVEFTSQVSSSPIQNLDTRLGVKARDDLFVMPTLLFDAFLLVDRGMRKFDKDLTRIGTWLVSEVTKEELNHAQGSGASAEYEHFSDNAFLAELVARAVAALFKSFALDYQWVSDLVLKSYAKSEPKAFVSGVQQIFAVAPRVSLPMRLSNSLQTYSSSLCAS